MYQTGTKWIEEKAWLSRESGPLGIVQESEVYIYLQIVYTQNRICPKNESHTILLDISIETRRLDLVLIKKKKTCCHSDVSEKLLIKNGVIKELNNDNVCPLIQYLPEGRGKKRRDSYLFQL